PPCFSCGCTSDKGKVLGDPTRYEWPKLIGIDIVPAKSTIERTNPNVAIIIVLDAHCAHITDFCCDRMFLCSNASGHVRMTPIVG
ncbi:hypothetical protein A4A49_64800, partial [Nicotiana attenuata]